MPSLRQLTCTVDWPVTGAPFQEYGTIYGDGIVETYIVVPDHPQTFTIHLCSCGYIAEGLAMFVYVDGNYQCNRNRLHLEPLQEGAPRNKTEVDFRVRQKETTLGNGEFLGREWRFDFHTIVPDVAIPEDLDANHFDQLGLIEVLVLRCGTKDPADQNGSRPPSYTDISPFSRHGGSSSPEALPEPAVESDKAEVALEAPTVDLEQDNVMPIGFFDGASEMNHYVGIDGEPSPGGYWTWHPVPGPSSYQPGYVPNPDTPAAMANSASSRREYASRPQPSERRVHFDDTGPSAPATWSPQPPYEQTRRAHAHPVHLNIHGTQGLPYDGRSRLSTNNPPFSEQSRFYDTRRDRERPPNTYRGWSSHKSEPRFAFGHQEVHSDWNDVAPLETPPPLSPPFHGPPLPPPYPPPMTSWNTASYPGPGHSGWPPTPGHAAWGPNAYGFGLNPSQQKRPIFIPPVYPPNTYFANGPGFVAPLPVPNEGWFGVGGHQKMGVQPPGYPGSSEPAKDSKNSAAMGGQGGNANQCQDDSAENEHIGSNDKQNDEWKGDNENATDATNNQHNSGEGWDSGGDDKNLAQETRDWNANDQSNNSPGTWNNNITNQPQADSGGWDANAQNQRSTNGQWSEGPVHHEAQAENPQLVNHSAENFDALQPPVPNEQGPSVPVRHLYGPHGIYYGMGAHKDEDSIEADEDPPYDVPASIAERKSSTHQVQTGRGYLYSHRCKRPNYVDDIGEPYARFAFKYRTRGQLERELGMQCENQPTDDTAKRELQDMSKGEVIEMLLRAQNALGGQIPCPPSQSQAQRGAPSNLLVKPAKMPAPDTTFLRYNMPNVRKFSHESSGVAGLGVSAAAPAANGPPDAPLANGLPNQMQKSALHQQRGGGNPTGWVTNTDWLRPEAKQEISWGDNNRTEQAGQAADW